MVASMRSLLRISIHAPVWGRGDILRFCRVILYISIHAPVWGRGSLLLAYVQLPKFQFTPPCGGGPDGTQGNGNWATKFQFTPPCGGGRELNSSVSASTLFQFTPPCGGGLRGIKIRASWKRFQFTPPCGGGLKALFPHFHKPVISIHAPVWGRTHERML